METKRLTLLSVLLALSVVINIVERIVMAAVTTTVPFLMPFLGAGGLRLGIANVVVLTVLYLYGKRDAFAILFLRVFLVALGTGTLLGVPFFTGLVGGMLAYAAMVTFRHLPGFSIISVSVMGAVAHVVGQILVAMVIVGPFVIFYFPLMFLLSIPAGYFVGRLAERMITIVSPVVGSEH